MNQPAFVRDLESSLETAASVPARRDRWLTRLARTKLFERFALLRWGRVTMRDELGTVTVGANEGPAVTVDVRDPSLYLDVATRGTVGAGEAYVRGAWSCDDLVGIVRIFVRNRELMQQVERGWARIGAAALRWYHARRDNTRDGARANIAAHYDLGNRFYELMLDETMMYSCAAFETESMSLAQAQTARLERIGRKLELSPRDHLLEIGSGWGGLALHAARRFGCRVTTTTISRRQFEYTSERVARAGLGERVTVLCRDYRDLTGRFDKLVSLEMIEAVGARWLDTYFETCSRLLEPHGAMLLQSITIRDALYAEALRSVDFIQRYVFPGSCIPSVSALMDCVARRSDFNLFHLEDIGPHYAPTLRMWRENLAAHAQEVQALGHGPEFQRLWEFYLCYCEGGFEERALGDVQMLLTKPMCRRAPLLPSLA